MAMSSQRRSALTCISVTTIAVSLIVLSLLASALNYVTILTSPAMYNGKIAYVRLIIKVTKHRNIRLVQ